MKIDFRAFQDNLEKRDFLYSKIDSKTYLDDDIIAELRSYFNEDYEKAVDIFEHKKDGSIKVVIHP